VSIYRHHFGSCIAGDFYQRTTDLDLRLDATTLPFADDSFDLVLFSEVIEHVPDARMAIREISRVLRPGGALLITWPFNYMIHESPNDYVRYTEFGMAKLLANCGLTVEAVFHRGNVIALGATVIEFLVRNALEGIARVPLVGHVFRPIGTAVCWFLFDLPYSIVFLDRSFVGTRRSFSVGEGLGGWRGSLRRWTLGYCLRARKVGGR
jgi:SAM-dependent methyltransferase